MIYGVCGGPDLAEPAARAGFTYFEWTVGGFLQPLEAEEAFLVALEKVRAASLPCPALNVFIPGSLKITGPEVDFKALTGFVQTAMRRASLAGVEQIVFGSGGARRIPDGFPRSSAMAQLVQFGRMVAGLADQHQVGVAVEPLNTRECNVLTSVAEAADYVREVDHPSFKLLVDAYHWALESEPVESIVQNGDLITHAHIATPQHRLPPGVEDYDFGPFLGGLHQSGYQGRLSVEAKIENPEADLAAAFEYLRSQDAA